MANDSLSGWTIKRLIEIENKEISIYEMFHAICFDIVNSESANPVFLDLALRFMSELLRIDDDVQWRKFNYIPREEILHIAAESFLEALENPKHPKNSWFEKLKSETFKGKEFFADDMKEAVKFLGDVDVVDAPLLIEMQASWKRHMAQGDARQATEPPKPPEPKKQGGKISLWLDWYHTMLGNGYKCTLEDVARKSGYSLGYIKQRHMVYQAKPNQKT